jgi:hypothetical protein
MIERLSKETPGIEYDRRGGSLLSSAIVPQSTQGCNSISGEDLAVRTRGIHHVTVGARATLLLRYS